MSRIVGSVRCIHIHIHIHTHELHRRQRLTRSLDTVSYNKHDPRVYDIAFFASRFIPAGEELTFDYLDKDEGEVMEEPGEDAIPCLCGAEKCRKWLWT